MPNRIAIPCDELRTYYQAGQSTPLLARRYGCSPTTIANRLRQCGVAIRSARFRPVEIPEAVLRRLYSDERRPIAAIADYFRVTPSTIGNKRRSYNIPPRPRVTSPGF